MVNNVCKSGRNATILLLLTAICTVFAVLLTTTSLTSVSYCTAWPRAKNDKTMNSNCLLVHNHTLPVPVVLMSLGRSGSSSIWETVDALVSGENDYESSVGVEYTGSDWQQARAFFSQHQTGDWLVEILCKKQAQTPAAGIAGIKWKPWLPYSLHPGAIGALENIKTHPEIKLVRSRRNPLDVLISRHKHWLSHNHNKNQSRQLIAAHCAMGDEVCLQKHLAVGTGMILPISDLIGNLQSLTNDETRVDRLLQELGVPHIEVSYEKLYHAGASCDEWKRILKFLGRPAPVTLTFAEVKAKMKQAPTSSPFHNVTLGNYNQVKSILAGTEFEYLLH